MIRNFFTKRFKLKSIYEAKDSKLIYVFIQNIIIGSLIAFPLVFQIIQTDSQRLAERVFAPYFENTSWQKELPDCRYDEQLTCQNNQQKIIKMKNQRIVFDPADQYDVDDKESITIIFGKNNIHANLLGFDLYGGYNDQLVKALDQKNADHLLIGIVSSVKMQAVAMMMQLFYPITIITNIIYIAIVALMALLFNIGNSKKLTYRQFFSFLSYAATLPAIFAFMIGTIFSIAFLYIAFNFGVILFAYFIYRKYNRVQ